jgi:hypothetical protein
MIAILNARKGLRPVKPLSLDLQNGYFEDTTARCWLTF